MKRVHIIRHAKSSWKEQNVSDRDRTLNQRGLRDAPVMARHFFNQVDSVDKWISSTSKRTRMTCQFFLDEYASKGHEHITVTFDPNLYHGSLNDYMTTLKALNNDIDSVLLFGHNYTITDLANIYSPSPIENVPTCGIVTIQFDIQFWSALRTENGLLTSFIYPKMYL